MKNRMILPLCMMVSMLVAAPAMEDDETDMDTPASPVENYDARPKQGITKPSQKTATTKPSKKRTFTSPDQEAMYKSLSLKNRAVYDSLSQADQDAMLEAFKNGMDPQKAMMKMLAQDQREHDLSSDNDGGYSGDAIKNSNSPAARSMKKQQRATPDVEDNIFN